MKKKEKEKIHTYIHIENKIVNSPDHNLTYVIRPTAQIAFVRRKN